MIGDDVDDLVDKHNNLASIASKVLRYQAVVEYTKLDYENKILERRCALKKLNAQRGVVKREVSLSSFS